MYADDANIIFQSANLNEHEEMMTSEFKVKHLAQSEQIEPQ